MSLDFNAMDLHDDLRPFESKRESFMIGYRFGFPDGVKFAFSEVLRVIRDLANVSDDPTVLQYLSLLESDVIKANKVILEKQIEAKKRNKRRRADEKRKVSRRKS